MLIAIIAWGSLIWDPRELPLGGSWQKGGPRLPLEFSRISRDGRLTLVIDHENGAVVDTYFATSARGDLGDAIADLSAREGTGAKRIGSVVLTHQAESAQECPGDTISLALVRSWLQRTDFGAAVWTALASNFRSAAGRPFTVENAVLYLEALPVSDRKRALTYFRNTPREVDTPLRRRLVELGWTPEYRAQAAPLSAGPRPPRTV